MQSTSDAFSSLLSDPRALSAIAEIMSSLQKAPSSPAPTAPPPPSSEGSEAPRDTPPPPPPPPPQSQQPPDLSGILGAALSNPELLSALPSVISMLTGMGKGGVGRAASSERLGALGAKESTPVFDRRCALLNALKPYLPEDKRATVDTVVRVIEIMSLI